MTVMSSGAAPGRHFECRQTHRVGKAVTRCRPVSPDQCDHPLDVMRKDSHAPVIESTEHRVRQYLFPEAMLHSRMCEDVHRGADSQFGKSLGTNTSSLPLVNDRYTLLADGIGNGRGRTGGQGHGGGSNDKILKMRRSTFAESFYFYRARRRRAPLHFEELVR